MVVFRAVGWLLLAMAVAAVVHDGLVWWSEGAFRLLVLGELWSRLDLGSLAFFEAAVQRHLATKLWTWVVLPILEMPALPTFAIVGLICLWIGQRVSGRPEPGFVMGTRPRRRRRSRGGLS